MVRRSARRDVYKRQALACSTQAPVVARGGGNLCLTLPEGGSGTISDLRRSGTDAEYDAALFATGEVTVTGEGSLAVDLYKRQVRKGSEFTPMRATIKQRIAPAANVGKLQNCEVDRPRMRPRISSPRKNSKMNR